MKKVLVDLRGCKEGEVTAEDICNSEKILVAPENTVLTSYIISRLSEFGVKKVWVYACEEFDAFEEENFNKYREFVIKYDSHLKEIKDILNGMASGAHVDITTIDQVSDIICSEHEDTDSVIKYLATLRETDNYTYNHSMNVALYALHISVYYIGSKVLLNNGEVGEVASVLPCCIADPIIKVKDQYINLKDKKDVKIKELIA